MCKHELESVVFNWVDWDMQTKISTYETCFLCMKCKVRDEYERVQFYSLYLSTNLTGYFEEIDNPGVHHTSTMSARLAELFSRKKEEWELEQILLK